MFPLKNTEAYIHANGFRSTLGKELSDRDAEINELGSEIQALTNQLTDEAETRAALGAHNLLAPNNGETSVTRPASSTDNILLGKVWLKANTKYIFSCYQETTITSATRNTLFIGKGDFTALKSESTSSNYHLAAGVHTLEYTPSTDGEYWLCLWTHTLSTDATYSQFMCRLATDPDPTYQPYAKTNVELTTDKADKSDLASISITGTTNNTGATITSGTYFYLNGQLVRARKDIASNASFTLDTNYEDVPGLLNAYKFFKSGTIKTSSAVITKASNGVRWIRFFIPTHQPFTYKIYLADGSGTEITSDFTANFNLDGYFSVYTWSTSYNAGDVVEVEFTFD